MPYLDSCSLLFICSITCSKRVLKIKRNTNIHSNILRLEIFESRNKKTVTLEQQFASLFFAPTPHLLKNTVLLLEVKTHSNLVKECWVNECFKDFGLKLKLSARDDAVTKHYTNLSEFSRSGG